MKGLDTIKIWHGVLESIKVTVSSAAFTTWFSQTHLSKIERHSGGYLAEVGCASLFVKSTIETRYYGLIQDSLSKAVGSKCSLTFVVKEPPQKQGTNFNDPLFSNGTQSPAPAEDYLKKTGLRAGFEFSNFAVSSSNQMAWAASEAVAEQPGRAYNPLFLWGGVGVGKTHLMNAIGYKILGKDRDASVLLCTGEHFTNDIVEGIRNKTTQSVRNKYRKLSALFVDDVQFIAGKDAVQEEFFHTFNALVNSGGQIVMTSDKRPSEIYGLEDRLKSRFEAGLIVDIAPPDFELRCAIAGIKAQERSLDLASDIVQLIAANIDSARKIEGFLVRLVSEMKTKNVLPSIDVVESLLGKGSSEERPSSQKINPNQILEAVSKYYLLGKRQLMGDSRARPIARPRQVLMYLLRTETGLPLVEVGRLVGNRDHTTVMHAVNKITSLASTNVNIREDIKGIKALSLG